MNEGASKNIIIILLVVFVIGLLGIIYFQSDFSDDFSMMQTDSATQVEEEVDKERSEEESSEVTTKTETPAPPAKTPTAFAPIESTLPVADFNPSVTIVTYTDTGFIPPVVEVRAGNSVTFVNSSSKPLWVTSEYHPTAEGQIYPGFAQGKSISKGGTYSFAFTKVGVWGYKNLNQDKHLGAVSVIPQ